MGDKEDYLTNYRRFFEYFAATVDPEDQLPVQIAGYTITETELPGEVLHWLTQYLSQKQCPSTLLTPLRHIILDDVRLSSKKSPHDFGYKPDEAVYEALRLMQSVTARANAICLRYLDNSFLDSLPPPPPPTHKQLQTASCAERNSRRVMEDRHVQISNLEEYFGVDSTEPTSFYAVYDGHAGSGAAIYCAVHLHQYLVESPHYTSDLQRAMRDAFLKTDAEFVRKTNQGVACGGSTAVAVCVRARRLLAAWAGDSLALLAKRMRLMQLVCAHKPHRQDEKERIESSGGTVMFWGTWRVNGQLAVSRAIGDAQYKPYVTARPEIAIVDLDGDEDFVVIACDGLWDFVSEDDVALTVYRQIAANPDDVNAVTKCLTEQAKRQGSTDNISIIVVFLKDPHAIAADNSPPMDLGLDNALANGPPFPTDNEACKRQLDAAVAGAVVVDSCDNEKNHGNGIDNGIDNSMDNSDSDSEDLGPETAVDVDDIDAESREHEQTAATPPVHNDVDPSHVEAPADNVAESGEDSDDEWNYFRGEGEPRADTSDREQDNDLPTSLQRTPTPTQDNSAWESSSVDMNSSPLNPDAPVFVPGSVAGSDVLLAESPRKPMPMDDIVLPDVAQFETEADVRPAELLDLDNCDQLNGHHNISLEESKEHLNGNEKCTMDSFGFGFNGGSDKDTALLHDFDRIQKDTTDFCNIQVFQTTLETNPFSSEDNDELFERLKNKERDPMSMSFYQEKDDDTCERLSRPEPHIDLNSVQPLPDSDDEDMQLNGCQDDEDKENIYRNEHSDLVGEQRNQEPNNDILRFEVNTNFSQLNDLADFTSSVTNMVQNYSESEFASHNVQEVAQTDTPESHKLLFEQIPEIPDGKSSELGFLNEDLNPSEGENEEKSKTIQDDASQDIELANKLEEREKENYQSSIESYGQEITRLEESAVTPEEKEVFSEPSQDRVGTAELTCVDVHQEPTSEPFENDTNFKEQLDEDDKDMIPEAPEIRLEAAEPELELLVSASPLPAASPAPEQSPLPAQSPDLVDSESPASVNAESPAPVAFSPAPVAESAAPIAESPAPVAESPAPVAESPAPVAESPAPVAESPAPVAESPAPVAMSPAPVAESPTPVAESPTPVAESPAPVAKSPAPVAESPVAVALSPAPVSEPPSQLIAESPIPVAAESPAPASDTGADAVTKPQIVEVAEPAVVLAAAAETAAAPADVPLPRESPPRSPTPAEEAREEGPAGGEGAQPDVVPPRSDLVTDLDIGIPESRAQEICVPVTSRLEEPAPAAAALLAELPIAAATATAAAAAAAAATVVAAAAKAKTPAKKSPTTPASKTTTPKTATPRAAPPSAGKKPPTPASKAATPTSKTAAAPKPATARVPAAARPAAPKPAATAPRTSAPKTSTAAARPAAPKPAAAAPRTSTLKTTTSTTASARPAPAKEAPKTATAVKAAPRPAAPKSAPASARTTTAAPRPAAPRPASARPAPAAPRPAPRAAPLPSKPKEPVAAVKPRPIEKKPLTNGDVKPAAAKPAPRPAPRPAPTTRAAPARPLDKQSKDLANKRITAKGAPPRTSPAKPALAPGQKPPPIKNPRKAAPPVKEAPSPPPADSAALPDVIA